MSGSVNKVILIGNLGKDPEVRTMQSGDKVCNLTIATSERWKDKSGTKQEKTEWHRVVVFNQGIINVVENYLTKGSKVYIEGQLETRKWTDKDGIEKYNTEVVLRPFRSVLTMLTSKDGGGARDDDYDTQSQGQTQTQSTAKQYTVDELEDEIPF